MQLTVFGSCGFALLLVGSVGWCSCYHLVTLWWHDLTRWAMLIPLSGNEVIGRFLLKMVRKADVSQALTVNCISTVSSCQCELRHSLPIDQEPCGRPSRHGVRSAIWSGLSLVYFDGSPQSLGAHQGRLGSFGRVLLTAASLMAPRCTYGLKTAG